MSVTTVQGMTGNQETAAAGTMTKKKNNELGKDSFLNLLVTQLKNQNPLEPVKDADFIAQIAQFSLLEQMQNLNREFMIGRAVGLLGKNIEFRHPESEQLSNGRVSGMKVVDGSPKVIVDDVEVPLSSIEQVWE